MKIAIHPLTADPTAAWRELSQHQKVVKINTKLPTTEAPSDKLRVVCMSDTHSLTPFIKFDVPAGDVFIHAGDFTKCGSLQEVVEFNNWIGKLYRNLPHKHKIVIAGNHELSFDPTFTHPFSVHTSGDHQKHTGTSILDNIPTLGMSKDTLAEAIKTTNVKDYLTNCTYLEDSEITLHGIKIYGTPWSRRPVLHWSTSWMCRIIVDGAEPREAQISCIWSHTRRYGEYYYIFVLTYGKISYPFYV
ncbi:PREDICTED: UPF0046 protein C25E10.12 isoform X4 [Wasmannia auropunctata]|uniref:UPF0046 protein C25E10.12 isoform X4 n=1 Tax=Wasmannia auropunctata TaxID=64793 RepID=UPI0005EDCDB0|nr:PREDICTED: UPF0046 protein C25E10.12 isoform X4 [Wasmannia auropunctata]